MQKLEIFAGVLLITLLLSGCSLTKTSQESQTQPAQTGQNQNQAELDVIASDTQNLGRILTDEKGMTLYIFTNDTKDTSVCYGDCAVKWPPLLTDGNFKISSELIAEKFSTTDRTDGTKQITYEGMPLYYWQFDTKPGDTTGQGVGGVWFVQKVEADDLSSSNSAN